MRVYGKAAPKATMLSCFSFSRKTESSFHVSGHLASVSNNVAFEENAFSHFQAAVIGQRWGGPTGTLAAGGVGSVLGVGRWVLCIRPH